MKSAILVALVLCGCVTTPETGSRKFILTSESEEVELGNRAYADVLSKERVSSNLRWTEILNRVGKRVAEASRKSDFQWEFKLIESSQKNAFCLPGGKVAFYTGIYRTAQTEAGLAAVMGHEVAHATARHSGQRITLAFGTELAFQALNAILGGGTTQRKQLLMAALGAGSTVGVTLPFSRAQESEADEIGLIYMARAGYDPAEAVKFWQRMAASEKGGLPKFLSTHPESADRMNSLSGELRKVQSTYSSSPQYGVGETL